MVLEVLHANRCEGDMVSELQESEILGIQGETTTTLPPPQIKTMVCDTGFHMVANRIPNPKSTYRYSPLSANSIRLLRLQPHSDEHALVQCQLFEYPFVDSGKGTHLYEALSYVWGSEEKPRRVSTNEGDIYVTENLHAALLRLRDHSLDRIVWADAICINQDDIEERNRQVQIMAKIYARASRVIVWLEEATSSRPVGNNDSADVHRALELISSAAGGQTAKSSDDDANRLAIRTLLQRSWFERIWVLQEVAAARHVLIMFHSMEIDGFAFCTGLNALNLVVHDLEVQSRIRSVTYLIKGASLRPKYVAACSDRFSLNIRPLGTLVDMYHNHKAKDWRDKIYALLGMSSDIPTDLLPNYNISWTNLFCRLVHSLIGKQASVQTWDNKQVAVIKHMGCVLGSVSSASNAGDWDDRLNVRVRTLPTPPGGLSYWDWTLQASANSIKQNDIVCLLQGASKPTIIRLCQDYGVIVAIAVYPRDDYWQYDSPQERIFNREFLLAWDWEMSPEELCGADYECFLNTRVFTHTETKAEDHWDKATRLRNIGQLLRAAGQFEAAIIKLSKAIEVYEQTYATAQQQLLAAFRNMLLNLAAYVPDKAEWLAAAADTLSLRGHYSKAIEQGVIFAARSADKETMKSILSRYGDLVTVTEELLVAATTQRSSGIKIFQLLLNQYGDQVLITEEVVKSAVKNSFSGNEIIQLLLDQHRNQVPITEEVTEWAAGNRDHGNETMQLLFDRYGDQVLITEKVVENAAGNWKCGNKVMQLLFDRYGDQVPITGAVVERAAGNRYTGYKIMQLLFDRYGDQVPITEEVVKRAASGGKAMQLLFDRCGDQGVNWAART